MFSDFFKSQNITTSTATWIFNCQTFVWNIFVFMVGPLCEFFGWRIVAFAGALFNAASLILTSFVTPAPYFMFITYSLLSGKLRLWNIIFHYMLNEMNIETAI